MDNLADTYYTKVKDSKNPALELTQIYCDFLDTSRSISIKKMFQRLVRLYGSERTFIGLLALFARYETLPANINRINYYLHGILSRKLEQEYRYNNQAYSPSLMELAEDNRKNLEDKGN
jgi:hypothetical protein